jgi:hypothetical protein
MHDHNRTARSAEDQARGSRLLQRLMDRQDDLVYIQKGLKDGTLALDERLQDDLDFIYEEIAACKRERIDLQCITLTVPREQADTLALILHANRLILTDPEGEGTSDSPSRLELLDHLIAQVL